MANSIFRNLSAIILLGAMPAAASAADGSAEYSEPSQSYDLNPVVVTGTGVHQRLKNTPVPVEVITASELKSSGINGLQEALTMMVPSLSFSPNAMGSYLRMNGLTNSHVLILLNGRKLVGDISGNVDLGQIDINTIKRIEVLNGAASTLYGSDAVGGVINIITAEAGEDSEFSSTSRYTRDGQFNQGLNLGLRAGKVGSTTSYNYSHSDGWQNSHFTQDGDELVETLSQLSIGYTSNNFNQKFTYDPTDRLSVYAEGSYYNRLNDRPVEREAITGGSKYNNFSESFSWGAGASYSLGDLGQLKLDYSGRTYGQWYKYMVATGDYLPGDYNKTKRQTYNDVELRGLFNFTENSNTIFGTDYRRETLDRPESDLNKGLGTFSLYGQHEHRFLGHFTALAGVRYDNYQEIGARLTPKVSLMYNTGNFNARATYAMGYRAPGIDELYYHMLKPMGSRYTITFGNRDLKAENSNYVSVNLEYRSNKFSVSVTPYMNFVKNMVTSSSTKYTELTTEEQDALKAEFPEINDIKTSTLTIKQYYNFAKATVKGVEANVTYNPTRDLSFAANYSYAYGAGLNDDGTWQRLNRSVMHTATITANYSHAWNWYRLNVNLNGRIQSKTYYPGDADGNAPGYGVWNLTTRHTFSCFRRFTLTPGVGIDNIFNRRDMRPLNSNFALYSPGRSVVASLTVTLK
ncbi:MAG: TonB-dependent receptor [Bacteroidales bacterium]|nr:TonB-dependent receptor [Bacteroidales bacterium]